MVSNQEVFERTRDAFFLNPKNPDLEPLLKAVGTVIGGDSIDSLESGAIQDVARFLFKEYAWLESNNGARRFDHLSVAQLHPSDNMLGILANLASTLANNNTIIGEVSPIESTYEHEAIRWMLENVAGYDVEQASGSLVSGGTSANLMALYTARESSLDKSLPDKHRWDGKQPITVFTSEMAHYSVDKALQLLAPAGLIKTETVPIVEGKFTMDPAVLEKRVQWARQNGEKIMGIVTVAGETETGQVDDIEAIAEIAKKYEVYLHVDGAYGAPFRVSRKGELFDAVSQGDSLTCDPHKYMYVPYSAGSVMFADGLQQARVIPLNKNGAGYMYQRDEARREARRAFINDSTYHGERRIEGSMGGQAAAATYLVTKFMGRQGLASLLDHTIDMTEVFTDSVRHASPTLRLSYEPMLNTACLEPTIIGKEADAHVEAVSATLEKDLGIYLRTTSLPMPSGDHHKVFRFVATHPYTDENDVRYVAEELIKEWEK